MERLAISGKETGLLGKRFQRWFARRTQEASSMKAMMRRPTEDMLAEIILLLRGGEATLDTMQLDRVFGTHSVLARMCLALQAVLGPQVADVVTVCSIETLPIRSLTHLTGRVILY
jgi:hypothetical protein